MIPSWAAKWIGLPYADKGRGPDAWDCWGLVRGVMAAEAGLVLPDYGDTYTQASDHLSVAVAVESGLMQGWQRVTDARALDLLIIRIAGRPWHCGVIVARGLFLHVPPKSTSCIERLDSPTWARRIGGFYRHA